MALERKTEYSGPRVLEPLSRPPYLEAVLIVGPFFVLAILSAVQIYFGLAESGRSPSLWRAVWTNLLAWAPWPLMGPMIIRVWRDRKPDSEKWLSSGLFHLVGSILAAFVFLVYLTFFRFAFFASHTGPLSFESFLKRFGGEVGQFFVPAWVTYWVIGAAGLAYYRFRLGSGAEPDIGHAVGQTDVRPDSDVSREASGGEPALRRIEIRSVGRTRWVELDEVEWIEADGSYVVLHTEDRSYAYRETMKSLEKTLASSGFLRIHRSAIVNVSRVTEIRPASHGDAEVRLDNGRTLWVSRTYRGRLDRALEHLLRR